jgi:hypothetical protein
MGDDHTESAVVAQDAAEAIQTLNDLTMGSDLRYPADVYTVLGALSMLAARLPQTFQQLASFLERQLQDGVIVIAIDGGTRFAGDPLAAISTAAGALLEEAAPAAAKLRAALDQAQQAISGASHVEPKVR